MPPINDPFTAVLGDRRGARPSNLIADASPQHPDADGSGTPQHANRLSRLLEHLRPLKDDSHVGHRYGPIILAWLLRDLPNLLHHTPHLW